jgi:hypothetical protein
MNPILTIVSIVQTIASALTANGSNPTKVAEYSGYLNLAGILVARWTEGNEDLKVLDEQLKEAVADGNRGLTAEQRAAWRSRDDLATDIAQHWLEEHS